MKPEEEPIKAGLAAVPPDLRDYVERSVLPRYDAFDAAHRRDHAEAVIARSMALAAHYPAARPACVYVVAAYHDVGLDEGRERHHEVSARRLLADEALRRWFDAETLRTMAEAVEDHRASRGSLPRSLYGCIVAEADRLINPATVVRRTVQYGLAHYPGLSREAHYARMLEHLTHKYGTAGYLRLCLPESPNAAPLAELRALIADAQRLRRVFEEIYDRESGINSR